MSDTHKSDLLLVVVTLFAAISWMFSKEAVLLMPPLTAIALLTVGLLTLVESMIMEPWRPTLNNLSPMLAWWVVASAVIGTAGRFLLQTFAQSLSANSHGVVILVLEPVWVALFAAGWFGESMTGIQLAGCGLIFAALIVNRWAVLSKAIKEKLRKRKTA